MFAHEPLSRELGPDRIAGHARPALLELKAANPTCSLARGADPARGAYAQVPLSASRPELPALRLDAAVPTAFAGFSGVDETLLTRPRPGIGSRPEGSGLCSTSDEALMLRTMPSDRSKLVVRGRSPSRLSKLDELLKLLPVSFDVSSAQVGAQHARDETADEAAAALETKLESALAGQTIGPALL